MIFNTTSKSEYVLFIKTKGFENQPQQSLVLKSSDSEFKSIDEIGADPQGDNKILQVYVAVSILLEDQIVDKLKLEKIGLYKLKDDKVSKVLQSLRPVRIGNKSAGVKAGFIKLWKAEFSLNNQEATDSFKNQYSVSFSSPPNITLDGIEEHLYKFGIVKIENPKLTYKYVRGSARLMGGRKYKNLS